MSFHARSFTTLAVAFAALTISACTTSSESDDLGVAPGFVYGDIAHAATAYGACPDGLSYVAYWGLRYANGNGDSVSGRWLGVAVSSSSLGAATWTVGTNRASDEAEAPANKASIFVGGIGGSQATAGARIKVTPFAGGDSVRIEGRDILLQNGQVVNFNLVNNVICVDTNADRL